ncbi:MAG: hypothetical protein ACOZDD_14950 [Bacteroidota bacterium]
MLPVESFTTHNNKILIVRNREKDYDTARNEVIRLTKELFFLTDQQIVKRMKASSLRGRMFSSRPFCYTPAIPPELKAQH